MHRQVLLRGKISALVLLLLLFLVTYSPKIAQADPILPPIAVVVNDAAPSPFGRYLGEILRAEGLNEFVFINLNTATLTELNQYRLVILAETPLTSPQAAMFNNFVTGGGRIIAMRPDAQIAGLFGLATAAGTQTDGYVRFETAAATPHQGIFRPSGVADSFDQHESYVPNVMKDVATAAAPCVGVPLGATCYRMWYEGVNTSNGYLFRIGYATSPDGLNWTRVPGNGGDNSNLGRGNGFDNNAVGISIVMKDGDMFRMWYEAKSFSDDYTIGHVVSTDGINWVRPAPNEQVYDANDDPATFNPDDVWSHWVIKDNAQYKLWYTTSTRSGSPSNSQRFAYASMTPGNPISISRQVAGNITVTFTTAQAIPGDGFIMLTFPPELAFNDITPVGLSGFAAGATLEADAHAVSDYAAANSTRGALLIRLSNNEPVGVKQVTFSLAQPLSTATNLLVQTFDSREVLEYGQIDLFSGTASTQPETNLIPNRQPWSHVSGTCSPTLQGAVFALVGTGCGGTGTTFDTAEIFSPVVIKDIASASAPCPGIANGNTCYRLWYVGTTAQWSTPRIGYAVSPDGRTWTRVPGLETGGSVLDEGPAGNFDDSGVTYMSVMKDGDTFKMWYSGHDASAENNLVAGIGYATSTDGRVWTRVTGSLNGDAPFPTAGLTTQTLQIHGPSSRYTLAPGAVSLATLYSDATTATTYPAVVSNASSQAIAFTYDLARNVVYTRQGNPANGDVDVDGDGVLRTVDLFMDNGAGTPWVDRNRIPVPQADEQQRLFARVVKTLLGDPVPQLWYFPDQAKTMLILTGDTHANPSAAYTNLINSVDTYGGDITIYISIGNALSDAYMQAARGLGHEFGLHPYWNRPDSYLPYNVTNLNQGYTATKLFWTTTGYSSTWSRTVRHHQVHWRGWTDAAQTAVNHGMALDTNFYHWGVWLQKSDGTWPQGYITGSGQPMKFMTASGSILPYYQQLTQLVDEQFFASAGGPQAVNALQAIAISQQLLNASLNGDYAAIMTQFHVDYYGLGDPKVWAEGTMAYAQNNGIPIWNADRWLRFTETRHDASYSNVVWNPATRMLTFDLTAAATPGINLTTILPLTHAGNALQSVTVDGAPVPFTIQTIKGSQVAFVPAAAGNHSFQATYQMLSPSPTPTAGPSPTPTTPGQPTATATTGPTSTPTTTPTQTPIPTATNTPLPSGQNALQFDGVNDEARGPQILGTNGTQTMELWLRPQTSNQTSLITLTTNDVVGWSLELNNGLATLWVIDTVGTWQFAQNSNVPLVAGNWYHLAVTYNASNQTAIVYVNGNQGAAANVGVISQGPWFRLGGLSPYGFFNGQLDEIRLSSNLRYTTSFTPPSDPFGTDANTRALYHLDQSATQTVLDSSGNNYHLTLGTTVNSDTADATWVVSTVPLTPPTPTATATPAVPTVTPTATETSVPPTPTATATDGPTPTPSDTPTATPTFTATPLPSPTATVPPTPLTHTTSSDFGPGCAVLTSTQVMDVGDGAVALAAAFSDSFTGSNLDPFLWSAGTWAGGAYNPIPSNNLLTIAGGDGAWVRSQTAYTRAVIETVAEWGNGAWQHIGFASAGFAGDQYLIFSTMSGGGNLYARVNNGSSEQNLNLGAVPTGLHRYRIEWAALNGTTDQVRFAIDGVLVAQFNVVSAGLSNLYLYFSNNGAAALSIDSVQVSPPYQSSGRYASCTLDAGAGIVWNNISWIADVPPLTGLTAEIRTSADGLAWADWLMMSNSSGNTINPAARYLEYRFSFTGNGLNTPVLHSVTVGRVDSTAPTPTNTPVLPTATVTNTPEPPTATATNTPEPPTATPTNTPVPVSLAHTTMADFGASCATLNTTQVTDVGDGAVSLAAAFSDAFTGSSLDPFLWSAGTWAGGAYNPLPGNSLLTIAGGDGAWVRSQTVYTRAIIQATAEFGNGAWQHIGFASDAFIGNRYFIFSTVAGDGNLYARVNNNSSEQSLNLGPIPTGLHRYRIEWTAVDGTTDRVIFYRDGLLQAQFDVTSTGASNLYLYLSNNGAAALSADSIAVFPPYQANGSYTSCVLDASTGYTWQLISWLADQPANTGLVAETRTSADGLSWSDWVAATLSTGSTITPADQFLQYRFTFSSLDGLNSPLLHSISLSRVNNIMPTLTNTPQPPTATPTNTPVPPTATPTNTPIPPTPTATALPIVIYASSSTNGTAGGVVFDDEDILIYNTTTATWSLFFDGSDVGLAAVDVDAFERMPNGTILFSVDAAVTLATVGAITDADIIAFTPTSTGTTTAGTFSWYFDGSDVGLTTTSEDIDALDVLSDGRIVISTLESVSVTGVSAVDEDLLVFTPLTLGTTTTGTWAWYFDGSDVGLSTTTAEDVNGVWVSSTGQVYLSTLGAFAVTGVSGDGADIFICTPGALGSTTTCTFSMYWDGSLNGFAGEVLDAFKVGQL